MRDVRVTLSIPWPYEFEEKIYLTLFDEIEIPIETPLYDHNFSVSGVVLGSPSLT
jgi:hypothetical protein